MNENSIAAERASATAVPAATLYETAVKPTNPTLCANDDETPAPFEFRLGHRRPTSWLCPTTMAQPI
jgi:hypothetical protein